MEIEISFSGPERAYLDQQICEGRAASEGDVLREALQLMMEREVDERRKYEGWRERTRRELDEAYEESLTEEGLDGPTFFEELRVKIEARGSQPS